MSDHASGHDPFEELAAGYVLDALEPADERLFLEHARGCAQCGQDLAGFREVAAALADTAPSATPSAQLGERIMAMARGTGPAEVPADMPAEMPDAAEVRDAGPAPQRAEQRAEQDAVEPARVRRLRPRENRWLRPVSIAAAAALIAAGGIWGGLAATSSSPKPTVAFCAHGCSEIVLTVEGSHRVAGKVYIRQQSVWMQPTGMKPDNTTDQIYVLWQIINVKHPLAIGSFDVRAGVTTPLEVGSLAGPYRGTLAFAVSLEHGRSIPPSPSTVTAAGNVT